MLECRPDDALGLLAKTVQTVEIVETVETVETVDIVETVESVETVETAETEETVLTEDLKKYHSLTHRLTDSEMEKRADGGDASVLFFPLGCANFLAVHVQISQKHSVLLTMFFYQLFAYSKGEFTLFLT